MPWLRRMLKKGLYTNAQLTDNKLMAGTTESGTRDTGHGTPTFAKASTFAKATAARTAGRRIPQHATRFMPPASRNTEHGTRGTQSSQSLLTSAATIMHHALRNFILFALCALAALACAAPICAVAAPKPLRALLITGGCCHDYAHQKDILKQGLEARANVVVDQIHSDDTTTHPPLAFLGKPDYAKGYDVVIHDECASDISDEAIVQDVLKPHREGVPAVNLHCAMHSYRIGNPNDAVTPGTPHGLWFEYLGLQSSGHGPQKPIAIRYLDKESSITKGLSEWTTINEEQYNNVHLFSTAHALARGAQVVKQAGGALKTNDFVVVWVNQYGPKQTLVFSTTIGHNNATVEDPRYLDLITRGLLWATGHLNDDGTPAEGYGPRR